MSLFGLICFDTVLPVLSSAAQSCPTLFGPVACSTPGSPVLRCLPEFAQTHVHGVSDAIETSHPVIPFSSCLQSFPASGPFPMSQLFASGGWSPCIQTSLFFTRLGKFSANINISSNAFCPSLWYLCSTTVSFLRSLKLSLFF